MEISFKRLVQIGIVFVLVFSLIFGGYQLGFKTIETPQFAKSTIGNELQLPILKIAHVSAATTADYSIDGTADDVQFQAALDALPATGGILQVMSSGNITFAATVSRAINNVTIIGTGQGTLFNYDASHALFSVGAQTGWSFKDLSTDAGSITNYNKAYLENIKLGATTYASRTPDGQNYVGNLTGWASNATLATSAGTSTNQSGGSVNATQIKDDDLTSGRVVIAGADGILTDDSDLTFSGDTLTATKFAGDGSGLTGLRSGCTVGTTFPTTPAEGEFFLHSVTGRKILYQYDGTSWQPIQSMGAVTVYVGSGGTDDINSETNGTDAAHPFATPQYAVGMMPPITLGAVIIQVGAGTFVNPTYMRHYNPTYAYNGDQDNPFWIKGTRSTLDATQACADSVQGTAGTKGTVVRAAGTWSAHDRQYKMVRFVTGANAGTTRIIYDNTDTTLTIVGTWPAAITAGDTFIVEDWATIFSGQMNLNTGVPVAAFSDISFTKQGYCFFQGENVYSRSYTCSFDVGTSFIYVTMSEFDLVTCFVTGSGNRNLNAEQQATVNIYTGTLMVNTCASYGCGYYLSFASKLGIGAGSIVECNASDASGRGIYADTNSVVNTSSSAANGYVSIVNCKAQGIYAVAGSQVVNTTNNVYSGNGINELIDVDLTSPSAISIKPSGDTDDYFTLATASNVPTIYGTGAYSRFGDAATTSHSLASEDDLLVTGKLEVDGVTYFDTEPVIPSKSYLAHLAHDPTLTMPVMNTNVKVNVLLNNISTGNGFDIGSDCVVGDLYGASGAYRQADADSNSTTLEDDDAAFDNTILGTGIGNWIKWSSAADGVANAGEGYATYTDTDTLAIYKSSGDDFAASYYYWIRKSYYVVPVSGYYQINMAACILGCEDGKRYDGYLTKNGSNDGQLQVTQHAAYASSILRMAGSDLIPLQPEIK